MILTLNVAVLAAWYFTSGDSAETEMTSFSHRHHRFLHHRESRQTAVTGSKR